MSYLALARKWRPRRFEDVVGQAHVVRALVNALNSGRVHHAFLFAGTRGVGKTTVARILARCLNCEQGISAVPCGKCQTCVAIEEGRFVDLIEVDAASRTGIDDIRDLLDNVQYTPSAGRYKVYLIDEVHMLSKQAFNALLKTLEEPPPHVKFLFATTDPQKLPVTVLSRCLQFNLKRLPNSLIAERMADICKAEGIEADPGAIGRLARAAAGSMRDGLSLLDQALAYGNDALREGDVADMLGSLDRSRVISLIQLLVKGDAADLLQHIRQLDELVPDYASLLDDLATCFQQIAIMQLAGQDALDDDADVEILSSLAGCFEPEITQLYYQFAVTGRRDLPLAPDTRIGFEMTILRMLAFAPPGKSNMAASVIGSVGAQRPRQPGPDAGISPGEATSLREAADWPAFVQGLSLDGAARQLALHAQFISVTPFELRLSVDRGNSHLATEQLKSRLTSAIHGKLGDRVSVYYDLRDDTKDTIATWDAQQRDEALRRAKAAINSDPNVRDLASVFGAEVVPESIKPVANGPEQSRKSGRMAKVTGHEEPER